MEEVEPRIASALEAARPDRVVVSGGEPTLVPNLIELFDCLDAFEVPFSLCTNATTVNRAAARDYVAHGLKKATVGFEGEGSTYDEFRGSAGGFGRAMRGLHALTAEGVAVTVNVVVWPGLVASVDRLAAQFRDVGVNGFSVTVPVIAGRYRDAPYRSITYTELMSVANIIRTVVRTPVAIRTPRCDAPSCPSGQSVFSLSLDRLAQLAPCPDAGSANAMDALR
jgi:MoaA/NifB/PqqE/SkfB family radical SAM enzyme